MCTRKTNLNKKIKKSVFRLWMFLGMLKKKKKHNVNFVKDRTVKFCRVGPIGRLEEESLKSAYRCTSWSVRIHFRRNTVRRGLCLYICPDSFIDSLTDRQQHTNVVSYPISMPSHSPFPFS